MSTARKLATEVAQCLKKVEEGVVLFDDIWEKVYSAGQQSLKEKYEGDLKKEIKKLQRLRDQIKTWLGSSEIKDKTALTDARKIIESKMEQFKVCEKDTKTKAYSKEGLARDAKLDPKEAAKEEKREWLNECIDRLTDLIDSIEADVEKVANKKKNKDQVRAPSPAARLMQPAISLLLRTHTSKPHDLTKGRQTRKQDKEKQVAHRATRASSQAHGERRPGADVNRQHQGRRRVLHRVSGRRRREHRG
jgi:CCR4-NOT transcriptional regulation complex NOT5 subunit